jgi:hypothetical protein
MADSSETTRQNPTDNLIFVECTYACSPLRNLLMARFFRTLFPEATC